MISNVPGLPMSLKVRRYSFLALSLVVIFGILYFMIFAALPGAGEIKSYQPETTVTANSADWRGRFETPVRIWAPLDNISPLLQKAVVISEDDLFFQHDGVNFTAMKEAFKINWQNKRYVRGASTITMQLARNAFLHKRKTLLRKIREIILAQRIEKHLSKKRILELYLNIVEWGENIYGAEAAARYYFGKSAGGLNLSEAALLAGMLPNPKYFNPLKRPESCQRMQKRVLWLMEISRQITAEQALSAQTFASRLRGRTSLDEAVSIDSVEEAMYDIEITEESTSPLHPGVSSLEDSVVAGQDSVAQHDSLSVRDSVERLDLGNEIMPPPKDENNGSGHP